MDSKTDREGATNDPWRPVFFAALGCFVLAACTGALFRFVQVGLGTPLDPGNIRHAHTHLMFFGWVTPAVMAMLAHPKNIGLPLGGGRVARVGAWAALGFGLASYVPFLLAGYAPMVVGGRRLPLSVIASGLCMLAWYLFAWAWLRGARETPASRARAFGTVALLLLALSTAAAWGVTVAHRLPGLDLRYGARWLTHTFLDLFVRGWLTFACLALATGRWPAAVARGAAALLLVGLGLATYANFPRSGTGPLFELGRFAGAIAGAGAVLASVGVARAARRDGDGLWLLAAGALGIAGAGQVGMGVLPTAEWFGLQTDAALRVLSLHLLLLGFVTTTLFAAARRAWPQDLRFGLRPVLAASALVLLSLLPVSGLWPFRFPEGGRWEALAVTAPLPAVAVVWLLFRVWRGRRIHRRRVERSRAT